MATGVLLQAMRDARIIRNYPRRRVKKGSPTAVRRGLIRRDAVRFLTGGGETFRYWCRALDLDAESMRVIMKRKLIRLKRLRRLRKLRVVESEKLPPSSRPPKKIVVGRKKC